MIICVEACGCTNACRHCAADGRPPFGAYFSLEELRTLREEWGPLWPGHESSTHPEFPDIVGPDIVGEVGLLSTNGFGLVRRHDYRVVLEQLYKYGYRVISFTLHGLEDHHDWFVARKGAFQDIITATRRAQECGFGVHWNVWLDRRNLEQIPALVELEQKEFGGSPYISVPNHRVTRRLWQYEKLRPSADDIRERLPRGLVPGDYCPLEERPIEQFTEAEWLRSWKRHPEADSFRFSLEPERWPLQPLFEHVPVCITREREVYLDLQSAPRILLGHLSEGKATIMQRLQELPAPEGSRLTPEQAELPCQDAALVHARGFSVRFKAASYRLYVRQVEATQHSDATGSLRSR